MGMTLLLQMLWSNTYNIDITSLVKALASTHIWLDFYLQGEVDSKESVRDMTVSPFVRGSTL